MKTHPTYEQAHMQPIRKEYMDRAHKLKETDIIKAKSPYNNARAHISSSRRKAVVRGSWATSANPAVAPLAPDHNIKIPRCPPMTVIGDNRLNNRH